MGFAHMDLDPYNWDPLSVDAVVGIFRDLPAPWWIANSRDDYRRRHLLSRTGRLTDAVDFGNVLPHLPEERGQWLLDGLRRQCPEGHAWMAPLAARVEMPRRKVP